MSSVSFPFCVPAQLRGANRVATVFVDTEEDFDWDHPVEGTSQATAYLRHIPDLQHILGAHGIKPTYLLTYPVLQNANVVYSLRRAAEIGQCGLGLQLHSWVTPPLDGRRDAAASFAGNLERNFEAAKLHQLVLRFTECFGFYPRIFRAGRYGLGAHTPDLLEDFGFEMDTSIAPRSSMADKFGPDFSRYDFQPFWFGRSRAVLELPLCRSVIGWGGAAGVALYRALDGSERLRRQALSLLAACGFAERITLSPEGNDVRAMRRLVRSLQKRRVMVLPVSFHSSSLWPGRNPYVRDKAQLHWFYDRLSAILCYLSDAVDCRFVIAQDLPALFSPPPAPWS
jgi:hypothetical protein